MKGHLREIHLTVGIATLLVFLGTGGYLRMNFPDLYAGDKTVRYLFRSRHLYILFSSLINILLGLYLNQNQSPLGARLQFGGSLLLLAAPPLHIAAFLMEPLSQVRLLTTVATFLSFLGTLAHVLGGYQSKREVLDP